MGNVRHRALYIASCGLVVGFILLIVSGFGIYATYGYKNKIPLTFVGDWPLAADPELGFAAAKNAVTSWQLPKRKIAFDLYTDTRGARVDQAGQQTPEQVTILTLGGSFSAGWGLENDQTYSAILGRSLGVPVANFAYHSYGTVQAWQLLERHADHLKPRIIIYGFIEDHLRRNLAPCAPSFAPFCLPVSSIAFRESGAPYLRPPPMRYRPTYSQRFFQEVIYDDIGFEDALWGVKASFAELYKDYMLGYDDNTALRQKSMAFVLQKLRQIAKRLDAWLVVMHMPYPDPKHTNPPPPALLNALTSDMVFIDLTPAVAGHYRDSSRPPLHFPLDSHPNSTAHQLIAHQIYNALTQRQILQVNDPSGREHRVEAE